LQGCLLQNIGFCLNLHVESAGELPLATQATQAAIYSTNVSNLTDTLGVLCRSLARAELEDFELVRALDGSFT